MAWNRCRHRRGLRSTEYNKKYKQSLQELKDRKLKSWQEYFLKAGLALKLGLQFVLNWLQFGICLIVQSVKLLPVWIYELFRPCPLKKQDIQVHSPFYIIGHRGADAYEIENTIPSFQKAIHELSANGLEMDLTFTKDKQVVVWHDWDPDSVIAIVRGLGLEPNVKCKPLFPDDEWRKPVHKLTLDELRAHYCYSLKKKSIKLDAHIPLLDEVFAWACSEEKLKFIILDIKTPPGQKKLLPEMLGKINAILEQYKPHFTVLLMSPEETIVREMKTFYANLNYTYDIELPVGIVLDPEAYSSIKPAVKMNNHFASVGRPTILELGPWTTYRRVIKFDMNERQKYDNTDQKISTFLGWTVNKKREMKCMIKMGVDGIVTDQPVRMKTLYDKLSK